MRKEVKLGFAIGGVLLAVLFVYVLVISSGPPKKKNVSLATPELSPAPAEQSNPSTPTDGAGASKPAATPPSGDTGAVAPTEGAPARPADADRDRWTKALETGKLDPQQLPLMLTETPVDRSSTPGSPAAAPAAAGTVVPPALDSTNQTASVTGSNPTIAAQVLESSPTTLPTTATPPAGLGARTHVVQRGESFSTIAAAVYGSESYYPHLLRVNPGIEPKKLRPGMTINLPDPAQVVAVAAPTGALGAESQAASASPLATVASPVDDKTQYRVRAGDSLYKVSVRLYGKSDRVDKLYQLNKDLIGPDPAHLKTGMLLKLPEPPTVTASAR